MGELFESIKRGMDEAIAHSKGEKTGVRVFTPQEVDVKRVREKTGLTQNQFAATFGVNFVPQVALPAVEAWWNIDFYTGLPLISEGKARLAPRAG